MSTAGITIFLGISSAVAKHILKSWIGNDLLGELSDELVDLVRGKSEASIKQRQYQREQDQLAASIADHMATIYAASSLPENSRQAVALEVACTLNKSEYSAEQVVEARMDPDKLAKQAKERHADATKLFSTDETALYDRLIFEASSSLVKVSSLLESFTGVFAKKLLEDTEKLNFLVEKIYQRPDKETKEFQKRYEQAIRKKLDRLEVFGIPELNRYSNKQPLSVAYISLDTEDVATVSYEVLQRLYGKKLLLAEEELEQAIKIFQEAPLTIKNIDYIDLVENFDELQRRTTNLFEHARLSLSSRPTSIESAIKKKRRIVVQGQAGSGKTTLLQWLAVRAASGDFEELLCDWNELVPFFIRLREYVNVGFPKPEDFLEKTVSALSGSMPSTWVHKILDAGLGLVLIDGVDEFPRDQRDDMLRHVADLVETYPVSRYVISSRPAALKEQLWPEWKEWVENEGFTTTTLRDMDDGLVSEFIEQWHEALAITIVDDEERTSIRDHVSSLKSLLNGRPALRRLAKNPLLCAMICALYQERQQNLPNERLKLYEECVEMLLTRRDEGRKILTDYDYPSLSLSQKLSFIQDLSYWMLGNGYSDIEASSAEGRFEKKAPSLGISEITGKQVKQLFVERTNLLREPVVGRLDFTHLTFQEYLAAREAIEESDFGVLEEHAGEDKWREVIVLAIGIARQKERENFLKRIIERSLHKNIAQIKQKQIALLALACLETSTALSPNLREEILKNASRAIPPTDQDEVKLVASAGDPAISLLNPKDEYSAEQTVYCIRTLEMIGSINAMEQLRLFADDARTSVCQALVSAWSNFESDLYAKTVFPKIETITLTKESQIQSLYLMSNLTEVNSTFPLKSSQLSTFTRLPNIAELTITLANDEVDLSPLSGLKSLRKLNVSFPAGLNDFNALSSVQQLTQLSIDGELTEIPIHPLKNLSNLAKLSLGRYRGYIPNLSELQELESLRYFKFIAYKTELDLQIIETLTQLETLIIESRVLPTSIDALSKLHNLIKLSVPLHMDYTDLSSIASLPKLKELTIEVAKEPDFALLASMLNLRSLKIISKETLDISKLASVTQITCLDLSECSISDINPIRSLENLQKLRISVDENLHLESLQADNDEINQKLMIEIVDKQASIAELKKILLKNLTS